MAEVLISKKMNIKPKSTEEYTLISKVLREVLYLLEMNFRQDLQSGSYVSAIHVDMCEVWKEGKQYVNFLVREYESNKKSLIWEKEVTINIDAIIDRKEGLCNEFYNLLNYLNNVCNIEPSNLRARLVEGYEIDWFVVEP